MNPISIALRRPITVMVAIAGMTIAGAFAYYRMKVDIFPALDLPVIYVCQPYGGMDPQQMEGLIANYYEYHFLYINGIHHVESKNIAGRVADEALFPPRHRHGPGHGRDGGIREPIAGIHAAGHRATHSSCASIPAAVPVGYLVLKSDTKTVGQIQDQALFRVRPMFAAIEGVSRRHPSVEASARSWCGLILNRLLAYGLSADQVVQALANGNSIAPSGQIREPNADAAGADQRDGAKASRARLHRSQAGRLPARRRDARPRYRQAADRGRQRHPDRLCAW